MPLAYGDGHYEYGELVTKIMKEKGMSKESAGAYVHGIEQNQHKAKMRTASYDNTCPACGSKNVSKELDGTRTCNNCGLSPTTESNVRKASYSMCKDCGFKPKNEDDLRSHSLQTGHTIMSKGARIASLLIAVDSTKKKDKEEEYGKTKLAVVNFKDGGKCPMCNKTLNSNHKVTDHSIKMNIDKRENIKKAGIDREDDERDYKCPNCDKLFPSMSQLKKHEEYESNTRQGKTHPFNKMAALYKLQILSRVKGAQYVPHDSDPLYENLDVESRQGIDNLFNKEKVGILYTKLGKLEFTGSASAAPKKTGADVEKEKEKIPKGTTNPFDFLGAKIREAVMSDFEYKETSVKQTGWGGKVNNPGPVSVKEPKKDEHEFDGGLSAKVRVAGEHICEDCEQYFDTIPELRRHEREEQHGHAGGTNRLLVGGLSGKTKSAKDDRYPEEGPYKIIRIYHPSLDKTPRKIKGGLTLTEAHKHTQDPKTRKEGQYFDAFAPE